LGHGRNYSSTPSQKFNQSAVSDYKGKQDNHISHEKNSLQWHVLRGFLRCTKLPKCVRRCLERGPEVKKRRHKVDYAGTSMGK